MTAFLLENHTRFRDEDLRLFVEKCMTARKCPPERIAKVTFWYKKRGKRRNEVTGAAHTLTNEMEIWLPRAFCGGGGCLTELAQTVEHEIDHLGFGLDHDQMPEWWTLKVLWAEEAGPIREKNTLDRPEPRKSRSGSRSGRG